MTLFFAQEVSRVCFEAPWSYYGALGGAGGLGGVKNKNRETKAFGNREFEGKSCFEGARAGACPWEHPSFIGAVA
jgi:hypothetical protein